MGVKRKRVISGLSSATDEKSSNLSIQGDKKGQKAASEGKESLSARAAASMASFGDNGAVEGGQECPYLDTVDRVALDFDMEKVCSATLSNTNVYACLVCGKFLHGRGLNTPCYTHSVHQEHFVFINLSAKSD